MPNNQTLKFHHKNRRKWKGIFLTALAQNGFVAQSARLAGVSPQTAYRARDVRNRFGASLIEAQTFAQEWDTALAEAAEALEIEARRRDMEGIDHQRRLFRNGQEISTEIVHHYSDQLIIFLLKNLCPQRYGNQANPATPPVDPLDESSRLKAIEEISRKRWVEFLPTLAALPRVQTAIDNYNVNNATSNFESNVVSDSNKPSDSSD
jgi:hypothetical protein